MREPEVALVFTAETWVEDLHRFFTDHGGARVRQLVVDPALARDDEYSTLVVSWRWPALTQGLVGELHERGRRVLGVFDRGEAGSRALLTAMGVDECVASDAAPNEFLEALIMLEPASTVPGTLGPVARNSGRPERSASWIAVGGPAGSGKTEIAIELARVSGAVLVDADEIAPAVAQRLGLHIEPNLRSAVDAVEFGLGALEQSIVRDGPLRGGVLAGLPNVAAWSQVRATEVVRVLRAIEGEADACIVDTSALLDDVGAAVRSRFAVTRAVLLEAEVIVAVGQATPLGVVRLLSWIADLAAVRSDAPLHIVLNRTPRDPLRRAELIAEIQRSYLPVTLNCVPFDRRVEVAGWNAAPVHKGRFTNAVAKVAVAVTASRADLRQPDTVMA